MSACVCGASSLNIGCPATCSLIFELFKAVFAVLRVVRPIAIVGNVLVATKASDVREVLERFDDFELGDTIDPECPGDRF